MQTRSSNPSVPRQITYVVIYSLDSVKRHREVLGYHVKDAQNRFLALYPSNNVVILDISEK